MSFLGIGLAVAFVGCYADKQATSDKSQQSAAKPLSVLSEKQKNQKKKAVAAKAQKAAAVQEAAAVEEAAAAHEVVEEEAS